MILARTLCGEASNQGDAGMVAVAHVVLNRVRRKSWFGSTVAEVCQKPYQFSCWNRNDPNRTRIERLVPGMPEFDGALAIAQRALSDPPQLGPDPTRGATHYHAAYLTPTPSWARGKSPVRRIGDHIFFTNID